MKKCSQCGASMSDDEVFCPVCGQEVQLVPDYETMESRIYEQQKRKEQEEERIRQEQEQARLEEEACRAKKRKRLIIGLVTAGIAAAAVLCLLFLFGGKGAESFESQMQKAETAYSNSSYEEALTYVEQALDLQGDSAEALTLYAQILDKLGDTGKAAEVLEQVIGDNPNYEAAYGILIRVYSDLGHPEKIQELLDACGNTSIKEKYSSYICGDPSFSLAAGTYNEEKTVEITYSGEADIYYTTDGSEPSEDSRRYSKAIQLEEGTTILKAVAVNGQNIRSRVVEAEYVIDLTEKALEITPASGSYTAASAQKITVRVPAGTTVYYAFDQRPDTSSSRYTGPVNMPDGTHTFYAAAINDSGRVTHSGSAVYVMDRSATGSQVTTPTPEPTREPSRGQIVTTPVPATPSVTPEATPTEEPEPTESPEPTEEPEGGNSGTSPGEIQETGD